MADALLDDSVRSRLVRFYTVYSQEKLTQVDLILFAFKDRYTEMFSALVKQYGPEPSIRLYELELSSRVSVNEADELNATALHTSYRRRLLWMFLSYCPEKILRMDDVVMAYKSREEAMMRDMVKKFGPEPPIAGIKSRLRKFYEYYAPEKIAVIDDILLAYCTSSDQEEIFDDLILKYGPDPVTLFQEQGGKAVTTTSLMHTLELSHEDTELLAVTQLRLQSFYRYYFPEKVQYVDEILQMMCGCWHRTVKTRSSPARFRMVHADEISQTSDTLRTGDPADGTHSQPMQSRSTIMNISTSLFQQLEEKYGLEPAKLAALNRRKKEDLTAQEKAKFWSRIAATEGERHEEERERSETPPREGTAAEAPDETPQSLLRDKLYQFYAFYAPQKLDQLDNVLEVYKNRENELLDKLVEKYGPAPTQDQKREMERFVGCKVASANYVASAGLAARGDGDDMDEQDRSTSQNSDVSSSSGDATPKERPFWTDARTRLRALSAFRASKIRQQTVNALVPSNEPILQRIQLNHERRSSQPVQPAKHIFVDVDVLEAANFGDLVNFVYSYYLSNRAVVVKQLTAAMGLENADDPSSPAIRGRKRSAKSIAFALSKVLGVSKHRHSLRLQDGAEVDATLTGPVGVPLSVVGNVVKSLQESRWTGAHVHALKYILDLEGLLREEAEKRLSFELEWDEVLIEWTCAVHKSRSTSLIMTHVNVLLKQESFIREGVQFECSYELFTLTNRFDQIKGFLKGFLSVQSTLVNAHGASAELSVPDVLRNPAAAKPPQFASPIEDPLLNCVAPLDSARLAIVSEAAAFVDATWQRTFGGVIDTEAVNARNAMLLYKSHESKLKQSVADGCTSFARGAPQRKQTRNVVDQAAAEVESSGKSVSGAGATSRSQTNINQLGKNKKLQKKEQSSPVIYLQDYSPDVLDEPRSSQSLRSGIPRVSAIPPPVTAKANAFTIPDHCAAAMPRGIFSKAGTSSYPMAARASRR